MRRSHTVLKFVGLLLCTAGCLESSDVGTAEQEAVVKVTVCHVPPGNPTNTQTISVGQPAVAAHLAHGDYLGACGAVCRTEGQSCTSESDCCLGACVAGTCDLICQPSSTVSCYTADPTTEGVGTCVPGTATCNVHGSGYGACAGAVTPVTEVCGDGADNDCDGVVNDFCVCSLGSSISCYGGPLGTEGVGTCRSGTADCNAIGTGYEECTGDVFPTLEVCGDGLDNDCDGVADDGCVCTADATSACYTGPAGTEGVGICASGTQTCNGTGTGYGACVGSVTPATETCGDGLDNDCDGTADEGCVCTADATSACYTGPAGTEGVGICAAGTQTCDADGMGYGACVGSVTPAATETCGDGLDNDCDGTTDEGCVCAPGSTSACYTGPAGTEGIGLCAGGLQTCDADGMGYGACVGSVTPADDTCGDGLDNDCDGNTDETCVCTPNSTAACFVGPGTPGVGVCSSGTETCNGAGSGYGACVGSISATPEVCGDGLDNDCDGLTDEGCIGDRAWDDANINGLQDAGEGAVAGATFLLRTAAGSLVAITVSSGTGTYWFSGVPAGNYYIEVIAPVNWGLTGPDAGDDTLDSDFDGESMATPIFSFSGAADSTWDAGFVSQIGG